MNENPWNTKQVFLRRAGYYGVGVGIGFVLLGVLWYAKRTATSPIVPPRQMGDTGLTPRPAQSETSNPPAAATTDTPRLIEPPPAKAK